MNEERLENFEKMLCAVQREYEETVVKMEEQKEKGRVNSATYRQLMGRKMTLQSILSLYELYDLI